MRGFSITLVFGKWGGVYMKLESHVWRICLGWVAFAIYPRTDIEAFILRLMEKR